MVGLVEQLQEMLFLRPASATVDEWCPDKEWNSETLECLGALAETYDLRPETSGRAECLACGRQRVRPNAPLCADCTGLAGK